MAHINLLPWREKQRQYQKQQYLGGLFAVAAIVGLIFWFVAGAIDQRIANQNSRNAYLQGEIAKLDMQIAEIQKIKESKNAIEQRMALIEQLQISRNVSPIIFDELARIVPPGVSFRSMQRRGNRIEIEGISDSNNRLSDFMRRLESSKVFGPGELSSIVADPDANKAISEYTLTFRIAPDLSPIEAQSKESGK